MTLIFVYLLNSLSSCVFCNIFRAWCQDRTIAQARKYVADSMGKRYADPVILNLEATWAESTVRVPLICFLSMGSDPTNQIENLAKKLQIGKPTRL